MRQHRWLIAGLLLVGGVAAVSLFPSDMAHAAAGDEVNDCNPWAYAGCCADGPCHLETRTAVAGRTCSPLTQTVSDTGCCHYSTPPQDMGCAIGSCAQGWRRYQQTSTVSGCDSPFFSCTLDATCGPTTSSSGDWVPYGFAEPNDSVYSFGLSPNTTKNMLGLAAKGNIIVGDYTDDPSTTNDFVGKTLPKLIPDSTPNDPTDSASITRPYEVDGSDAVLGYDNNPGGCNHAAHCFDGNYNQSDGGQKLDGTPRKFYESSLNDADFRALVDPNMMNADYGTDCGSTYGYVCPSIKVSAILYTNHALAGLVKAQHLAVNGAMISRDDALVFNQDLTVNHDARLVNDPAAQQYIALPFTLARPSLIRRRECSATGC